MAGPLHDAIKKKQWSTAKELLAGGADPNEELDGQTATAIYMIVVHEEMGRILKHLSFTLPEQLSSDSLLSVEDSINLFNTFNFYAEILPYLSQETVMHYAMMRAMLDSEFKKLVKNILDRCRNSFSDSNSMSMFELTEKVKAILVSMIQQLGEEVKKKSVQYTPNDVEIITNNISKILKAIKESAVSQGFELSEAQLLSMMMIHSIGLNILPEEATILDAYDQPTEPDSKMETESSETQPLSEEPSLNENATAIPQTLPLTNPGMGLTDFLPPASH